MQREANITWRGLEPTPFHDAEVRKYIDELDETSPRITGVDVVIERPHRSGQSGELFHVRVDVQLPGEVIVVTRDPPEHHAHEELHVAMRDAFRAARRRLEDHGRVVHGKLRPHDELPAGELFNLSDEAGGYGFIRTDDGREIYFHHNAVRDLAWSDLHDGLSVHYVEGEGEDEKGPQASAVYVG